MRALADDQVERAGCRVPPMHPLRKDGQDTEGVEAMISKTLQSLLESAWVPETVDRRAYLTDDPTFGLTATTPFSAISDRIDGKFRPYYETETDLAYIRGSARNLGLSTPVASAVIDRLAQYTFGPGFGFTARSADARLAGQCQQVINRFLDDTDFVGSVDVEIHRASREDGEAFCYVEQGVNGRPALCFVEPDQIREPGNVRQLEAWLADFGGPVSWSFGVRAPESRPSQVLGYHVVRDDGGLDWDYVPAWQMLHVRRNTGANAKRGVSDMFLVFEEILREAKLRRNMAEGAALQAAIAWILQSPAGTSQSSIQTLGASDAVTTYNRNTATGSKPQRVQRYQPGTILKPSPGLEYKPGPMGADRNDGFGLVAQYLLRIVGVRWAMPEYMISGDASNANYASTLVSESPFVKAREADQAYYARQFEVLVWKVLRMAHALGQLPQVPFSEIEQVVEIEVTKPSVATRNAKELAEVHAMQLSAGLISRRTAATQAGLDYDGERRALADEQLAAVVREAEGSYDAPEAARNNARKVLAWRDKYGDAVKGMTQVGWTRANQLASGERLSRETVGRMAAFARHRKNAEVAPEYKGEPWRDAGHVAWLGWGGTTGVDWAAGIVGNVNESCGCESCSKPGSALREAIAEALASAETAPETRAILRAMSDV